MTQPIDGNFPIKKPGKIQPPLPPDGLNIKTTGKATDTDTVSGLSKPTILPDVTIKEVDPLTDNGTKLAEQELHKLQQQAAMTSNLIEANQTIKPDKAPSAEEWAKKNAKLLVDLILAKAKGQESYLEAIDTVAESAATPIDLAVEYFAHPVEQLSPLFTSEMEEKVAKVIDPIMAAELAFQIPATLGKAGALIYKKVFLNQVKAELQKLKQTWEKSKDPELEKSIVKLEQWTKAESERLKKEGMATIFGVLSYAPRAVSTGLTLAGHLSDLAGAVLKGVGGIISSVLSFLKFRQTRKDMSAQKQWISFMREKSLSKKDVEDVFKQDPSVQDALTLRWSQKANSKILNAAKTEADMNGVKVALGKVGITIEGKFVTKLEFVKKFQNDKTFHSSLIAQYTLYKATQNPIETILEKRKNAFAVRKEQNRPIFYEMINTLIETDKNFEEIKDELLKVGVRTNVTDRGELKELVEVNDDLLNQYVKFNESSAIMARKSLKALAAKKQQMERGILKFRRNEAAGTFAIATLSTAAFIAIKTALVVGAVVIPATALAASGIGLMVLGLAPIAAGLIYLGIKKPNTMKTFLKGVQLKIGLYSIPKAIQEFRLGCKKVNAIQNAMSVNAISARLAEIEGLMELTGKVDLSDVPIGLQSELTKLNLSAEKTLSEQNLTAAQEHFDTMRTRLEEDRDKFQKLQTRIDQEVKTQEKKVSYWTKKVKPLSDKVRDAKYADFVRGAKLAKDAHNQPLNIVDTVIDGILTDETMLDKDTRFVLKEQLGINLETVKNKEKQNQQRQKISESLKKYLGMSDTEVTNFIRKQQTRMEGAVSDPSPNYKQIRRAWNEVQLGGLE